MVITQYQYSTLIKNTFYEEFTIINGGLVCKSTLSQLIIAKTGQQIEKKLY